MSDTPRTDAMIKQTHKEHVESDVNDFDHYFLFSGVCADFARTLERENTALREQLKAAESDAKLKAARQEAHDEVCAYLQEELNKLKQSPFIGAREDYNVLNRFVPNWIAFVKVALKPGG